MNRKESKGERIRRTKKNIRELEKIGWDSAEFQFAKSMVSENDE